MLALKILLALAVNAVPVYGVFRLGWSVPTVLVLFWVENLLGAVFTTIRIAAHRRWTRKRGHWRPHLGITLGSGSGAFHPSTFLAEYAAGAFPSTLAHGIFVAAICAVLSGGYGNDPRLRFSLAQLERGAAWMAAILVADLLVDLPKLKSGSFAWLELVVRRRMWRVFVLHLAIIFGMLGVAFAGSPFAVLYVLFGLKTLFDVSGVLNVSRSLKHANEEKSAAEDEEVRFAPESLS